MTISPLACLRPGKRIQWGRLTAAISTTAIFGRLRSMRQLRPAHGGKTCSNSRQSSICSRIQHSSLLNSAHYQRSSRYNVARDPSDALRASLALAPSRHRAGYPSPGRLSRPFQCLGNALSPAQGIGAGDPETEASGIGAPAAWELKNRIPSHAIDSGRAAKSLQMDAAADSSPSAKPKLSMVSQRL
jgi:hypothetical protein